MSRIDEAAKPTVSSLIRGELGIVAPEAQIVLSAWFTKTAIVADSRNPARSVVPDTQRKLLRDEQRPPAVWEIWLMSYDGTDFRDLGLHQNGGSLNLTPIPELRGKLTGYAQTTFIGMGRLAILVVANDLPVMHFNVGKLARVARRIWPVTEAFDWPINSSIGDEDAIAAADILKHMIMNPRNDPP
jgi:hypothetical protein